MISVECWTREVQKVYLCTQHTRHGMIYTYKDAQRVTFPIFLLHSDNWSYSDGILFLDNRILDDTNMPGDSLGIRRVQTPHKDLYPLKKSLINLTGILKQSVKTFIDSEGVPFIYEKSIWCSLKYYKIKRVDKKDIASVLWLHGVSFPITVPRPPADGMEWAGMLHFGKSPWLLYEYAEEKLKDTKRKV